MKQDEITFAWLHARCHEDGDCLIWDRSTDGKSLPRARINNANVYMRPFVWRMVGKSRPGKGRVLIMTCGNSRCLNCEHMACVHRSEVLKQTVSRPDVAARKNLRVQAASRARGVLDAEKVRYIRASTGKTLTKLAQELGVSFQLVSRVRRGERWRERTTNPFAGLGA